MQELIKVAIVGAGASGCICAYFLLKNGFDVTLFDKGSPLRTILPTGGGRCNLAHAEFEMRELSQNYPRGEKFLYSVFSKFSTYDTLGMFQELGIETYTQEDGRIFPISNSSKEVRTIILDKIKKAKIIREEVIDIQIEDGKFRLNNSPQLYSHLVLATGGHSGLSLVESLGLKTVKFKPSLVGLNTKDDLKMLSGTVVKNVKCMGYSGDLLFTHFGFSGPLIYTISSIKAFDDYPYDLSFDFYPQEIPLQPIFNQNPHKEIKNILKNFLPQKFVKFVLADIDETIPAHKINGEIRDFILNRIHNLKFTVVGANKGEETVSAGGIELSEINSKTMESKNVPNLYCIGEVLNIDGFCGGFNLQNAWSTAFVASEGVKQSILQEEQTKDNL
jgi:hypothetical protein